MPVELGELLLKEKLITPEQLQEALLVEKLGGVSLGRAVVNLRFVMDEEITGLLSRQYGVPSVGLGNLEIDPAVIDVIPGETARKYHVLPISRVAKALRLAMADPTNLVAIDDISFMTGFKVEPVVASETALEDAIHRYYDSPRSPKTRPPGQTMEASTLAVDDMAAIDGFSEIDFESFRNADTAVNAEDVIKLTNVLLVDSLKRGASSIHIEPYRREFRVRYRIDGVLYNVLALPMNLRDPLISRIKFMAKLKGGEKRVLQEGRIQIRMQVEDRGRDLDFLVRCLPTLWGEIIVMRLLDNSTLILDRTKLGLELQSLKRFEAAIAKPYGIVLFTGPARSGKTTTLHSALLALNKPDYHLLTVEDPVEFNLPGVNQVQVNEEAGASFPAVLRSLRRLDPDVIAVSEIRNGEAAMVMVELALNGHLLLTTLDTNDAPSTVSRLANMGLDLWPMAVAVNLIQAQRLVRRICTNCGSDDTGNVPSKTLADIGFKPDEIGTFQLVKGRGCTACNGTGYKGRVGLFEGMEISEGIRHLIVTGATAAELRKKALEEGMVSLRMSGLEKVKQGITTIEEVLRETVA